MLLGLLTYCLIYFFLIKNQDFIQQMNLCFGFKALTRDLNKHKTSHNKLLPLVTLPLLQALRPWTYTSYKPWHSAWDWQGSSPTPQSTTAWPQCARCPATFCSLRSFVHFRSGFTTPSPAAKWMVQSLITSNFINVTWCLRQFDVTVVKF